MARIAAAARTTGSLLITAAVLGAAAAALARWAGWPLPDHWPSSAEWTRFAEQPLSVISVPAVLATAGWLLWLFLVASIGLQAWIHLTRRPLPFALPRPVRLLVAGMLGTSVIALTTPAHASPPVTQSHTTSGHEPSGGASVIDPPATTADTTNTENSPGTRPSVDVPGGWIVWPVAVSVLAATATALLRSGASTPATAVLLAIRAARHDTVDPSDEEPPGAGGDDLAALEQDATGAAALTLGLNGTLSVSIDALPPGGVGITGPGSADALRGILAATACTGTAVVIPRILLDDLSGTLSPLPAMTVTADADAALHAVQMEIHRRYAETSDQPADVRHPQLVLLTDPTIQPRRLAALAELGAGHNVHVIAAGPWPAATWSVNSQGHATAGTTTIGRLNILSGAALAQIASALQPNVTGPATAPALAPPTSSAAPFHLHILGSPRLAAAAGTVHIRRSGSRQIAVYLALHPDGVSRDELLEMIFGHMKVATAGTSLNSCLYELRRLLTINGDSGLQRHDNTYRLHPQQVTVDWWQLLQDLKGGHLDSAIKRYAGHVADGYDWDWLPEHRHTARRLVADAHASLARSAITPDQALTHALEGVRLDPYSEACHEAAIGIYTSLGQSDRAQALRNEAAQRLARLHPR